MRELIFDKEGCGFVLKYEFKSDEQKSPYLKCSNCKEKLGMPFYIDFSKKKGYCDKCVGTILSRGIKGLSVIPGYIGKHSESKTYDKIIRVEYGDVTGYREKVNV